jgi:thioredoxin reductase (NADPH)
MARRHGSRQPPQWRGAGYGLGWRSRELDRIPFSLETSVPGVFVAGDVRHGSVKRVASAVGEGSMAVMYVHRYLNSV